MEGVEVAKGTRYQARDARSNLAHERAAEAKELRRKQIALREQKASERTNFLKASRDKRNVSHSIT